MEKLLEAIWKKASRVVIMQPYIDLLDVCTAIIDENPKLAVKYLLLLSDRLEVAIPKKKALESVRQMYDIHKQTVKLGAKYNFHLYLLYVEWYREPDKKFYPPRKKILRPIVEELQRLADGELDILGISLPPGAGKSTLAIFYLTWLAGKYSDEPILTGSHSNSWVRGAYDECLRIMQTDEYRWRDVFKDRVSNTNAKDCRIDVGFRKRFETLEFTSVGTGNAGLYRASRLLYCDDLVSGIEVAMSKERLDKLWEIYTTDLRQRKIGDHCAELHIATRWSVHDVIGRLEAEYEGNDRAKFIVVPALNENDESNLNYDYGVGFSTDFFREQREIMDEVSWKALYMGEPIEREGLLYNRDELRRYFELPSNEPDAILSICDTKDRGKDYCVMPIVYQYGNDYYIEDVVCDNSAPEVVEARLVSKLLEHKVQMSRFESNSAGGKIAEKVQKEVKEKGGITNITTKFTSANKETKIIVNSPFVKERFLFKDDSVIKKDKEYQKFLEWLCTYTMMGKNKHDDVPDALAMLSEYVQSMQSGKAFAFSRPF